MKEVLKNIIKSKGVITNLSNKEICYLEIVNFIDIDFSYGIIENSWVIRKKNREFFIHIGDDNYISFFSILELPSSKLIDTILDNVDSIIKEDDLSIFDLFPIVEITKTALNMESSYWSSLAFDTLLNAHLYSSELLGYLLVKFDQNWLSQSLKHKISKYISRTRDNEWKKSNLNN